MPNGNVLLIAYEVKTPAQVTQAGSSMAITMWPDKIVEIQPTGPTTGIVVWEWHAWDHLVQNVDPTKDNYYPSISDHPELLNINYQTQKDWLDMNGVDYNPILDQITWSSHNTDEVYIIDPSTTSGEAAGHSGGNSGKGGDILYGWGNPAAYNAPGTHVIDVVHDAKFNLYAYDPSSGKTSQVTKNRDWDIRWPSSDNRGRIVYERDGEIELMDVGSKRTTKISVNVPDDGLNKRKRQVNAAPYLSSFALSPKGERALFSARGDIFTVPVEKGGVRNLTRSSDANDRFPDWSHDGKQVAYISDKSGDEEIWIVAQDGSSLPEQLTTGGHAQRYDEGRESFLPAGYKSP